MLYEWLIRFSQSVRAKHLGGAPIARLPLNSPLVLCKIALMDF